ncbi:sugar transferase [Pseudomonadales bacterium]|jgi:O-antigen biosynthesis protein WbqP|nr:sugar transferase [Pseudomonadales bacterium]MDA8949891.1 sugar transferase [Pseudomonadales bacterium]
MRRLFDLIFAVVLFPIVILFIILCSISIAVCEGRPIFFRSERLGRNQQSFTMIKLRTMSTCAPLIPSSAQNAAVYVTKLGRFLRLTSLDELPQLFNILNGSMTFIGPRPCLSSEYELVERRKRENIFAMTPGVTGLAQVRGRDKNSARIKVHYESFYQKKRSLLFDLKIILITIRAISKFSDVSH